MKDIKKLNIPNVCFSLVDKEHHSYKEYKKQRKTVGFDDSETWSLDITFANFMLPRLKRYIEITDNMFDNPEFRSDLIEFKDVLELSLSDEYNIRTPEFQEKIELGLSKFSKIFFKLWW